MEVTRTDIMTALVAALKPLDYLLAVWEGGAASFGRIDEWSDIDLYVVCEDDHVEETIRSIENSLLSVSEIDVHYRLPEPTWHGHSQCFYRLKRASPFLFLDVVVMKRSSKDKFLQFRIHGGPQIYFDKSGVVKDDFADTGSFLSRIEARLQELKTNFELFQVLTLKELNRGNSIEALVFYLSSTYRPLVEVLRIKYCPLHYNFYSRYIHYELPPDVVERLSRLAFSGSPEDIRKNRAEAEAWFWKTVESIDLDEVKQRIQSEVRR